jgi:alanine racemase
MNSTAISIIDLQALKHNLHLIRRMMPGKKIMAMVKCNAYGHELVETARAIASVDALGVATIDEALRLRKNGIDNTIVVMRGFVTQEEMRVFFEDQHLVACIHDMNQLRLLEKTEQLPHKKLRIWLKVDTGMHRLGFPYEIFHDIYERLNRLSCIESPFVVCSHLAEADSPDSTFTQKQMACFQKITASIPNEKSLLNSAGILAYPECADEWIRPGLMLYGVSPFHHSGRHDELMKDFIPVMTLESKLIAVNTVKAGEKIGYSCTFTATRPMKIGIVGMGYGDSYPRHAKNGTPVLIRGERCPIVGRVSMDMITVDVSHLDEVAVDDTVTLWGRDLLVAEIAQCVNTVPHELLCHLTGRVQPVYLQ